MKDTDSVLQDLLAELQSSQPQSSAFLLLLQ